MDIYLMALRTFDTWIPFSYILPLFVNYPLLTRYDPGRLDDRWEIIAHGHNGYQQNLFEHLFFCKPCFL